MTLYDPPVSHVLTALLVLAGAGAGVVGVMLMSAALRCGNALQLIRGIRLLVLGLVAGLASLTFATGNTGFLVIGLLILAEEIYETATLAAIVRLGDRNDRSSRHLVIAPPATAPSAYVAGHRRPAT